MKKNSGFRGRLYVTIDTEMDADLHWKKADPPQFSSVTEGIPEILRPVWDAYRIRPIYFVSPEVVQNEACCSVLQNEIKKGAVIGAHLHPEYIEPDRKRTDKNHVEEFPCTAYSRDIEKEKLYNLSMLIKKQLKVTPKWYRAARFGADADTIAILQELGYLYDSSFTPNIDWTKKGGPDHRYTPVSSYYIHPENIYKISRTENGIKEYPVTILGKRFGIIGKFLPENWLFYQWLRPTHMSYLEQRHMIQKLRKAKIPDLVMMFHSMEIMIGKTPYVRTEWMQKYYLWRLKKTIKFALEQGYTGMWK